MGTWRRDRNIPAFDDQHRVCAICRIARELSIALRIGLCADRLSPVVLNNITVAPEIL